MKTTSLEPNGPIRRCHVCGHSVVLQPSRFGDATCPKCGNLLWPYHPRDRTAIAAYETLRSLGATFEMDADDAAWKLNLSQTNVTDDAIRPILELGRITELDLSDTRVTDTGVQLLAAVGSLEVLELANTPISDQSLSAIARLTQLEVLGLNETAITDSGLPQLDPLHCLWCLDLDRTSINDQRSFVVISQVLANY